MVKIEGFYKISAWRSGAGRIRRQLVFKKVIHFGADRSCEVRQGFVKPLIATLDLEKGRLQQLDQDKELTVQSGQLFELEGQIFSFERLAIFKQKSLWMNLVSIFFSLFVYFVPLCPILNQIHSHL